MPDTDQWPFVKAKWFTPVDGKRKVRVIVIHDMEAPETPSTAENVAKYFQVITRPASAHICVDSDSIVQCVWDNNVAFAAPGVNHDGIHIELAGYAIQDGAAWLDPYGVLMLDRAANAVAQYCRKYNLPCTKLTPKQLKAGAKGIIGHRDATAVYKPNAGHQDPGGNFPWEWFIKRSNEHLARLKGLI